ncbi:MAG: hypothetical protein HW397_210 [Dehalococcoidia bacterium]|nr:hypothetical protein [Dehalococcoidia bacterium]
MGEIAQARDPLLRPSLGKTTPRCGGRQRVIAAVQDPLVGQVLLAPRARSGAALRIKEWTVTARQGPRDPSGSASPPTQRFLSSRQARHQRSPSATS